MVFLTDGSGTREGRLEILGQQENEDWACFVARVSEHVRRLPPEALANTIPIIKDDFLRETLRAVIASAREVPIDEVRIDPPPTFTPRGKVYTMHPEIGASI